MNPSGRMAGAVGMVAAAAAGGFLISRLLIEREPPAAAAPLAMQMAPAPLRPPQPTAAETVPDLTLPDIDGRPHALSEWAGRPLLINFWATWCEPCRREIPLLEELRAAHAARGLEVLGIALDSREAVATYLREAGISYPILIAEDAALTPHAFGVGMGLPSTVFADRSGRIRGIKVGELKAEEAGRLIRGIMDPDPRTSHQKVP